MWIRAASLILLMLALPASAPSQPPAPPAAWQPRIETIPTPAGPASSAPQLTVSARGPLLSWIERSGASAILKFSEWTSAGWSKPVTAASGTDWFVNWADVPSVLRLDDSLVAQWLQKNGPGSSAYDVRLAHSSDDGRTWSPSFTPHHDGTATEHGFASLFQMPGGGLGLVWLDGRAMTGHGHGHGGPQGGAMSLRFARYDRRWKQVEDVPVDLRVCDCCPTTAVVTAEGPIAAFRNRTDREVRDIHVTRLSGGKWTESRAIHDDGWAIQACPVNGPTLSARDRTVAASWFTVAGGQGRAFAAFSSDAGRTFGGPVRLDDETTLGRVDVELLPDGSAIASWIELAGQQAQLKARRIEPGGSRSPALLVTPLAAGRASGYPRMAVHGDELLFAWTDTVAGRTQVRTAIARNALRR